MEHPGGGMSQTSALEMSFKYELMASDSFQIYHLGKPQTKARYFSSLIFIVSHIFQYLSKQIKCLKVPLLEHPKTLDKCTRKIPKQPNVQRYNR